MILIDGKKAAAELREELKKEVSELKSKNNKVPGLTVILIEKLLSLILLLIQLLFFFRLLIS